MKGAVNVILKVCGVESDVRLGIPSQNQCRKTTYSPTLPRIVVRCQKWPTTRGSTNSWDQKCGLIQEICQIRESSLSKDVGGDTHMFWETLTIRFCDQRYYSWNDKMWCESIIHLKGGTITARSGLSSLCEVPCSFQEVNWEIALETNSTQGGYIHQGDNLLAVVQRQQENCIITVLGKLLYHMYFFSWS